jgi:hypothetical protein
MIYSAETRWTWTTLQYKSRVTFDINVPTVQYLQEFQEQDTNVSVVGSHYARLEKMRQVTCNKYEQMENICTQ